VHTLAYVDRRVDRAVCAYDGRYLEALLGYLLGFLRRAQPLRDVEALVAPKMAAFVAAWAAGTVRGWEPRTADASEDGASGAGQRALYCLACTCGVSVCVCVCVSAGSAPALARVHTTPY
jgi:hypothetical protein